MIRKALMLKLFDAAYMQRWNDKLRPVELIELDKQAHKMIIAWFLARYEESAGGTPVDWVELIEGGIFELLQRIVITDLKPPIFYKIKADQKKYRKLNEWVFGELKPVLSSLGKPFCRRFQDYFTRGEDTPAKRILGAAHFHATKWEFAIIERSNPDGYDIDEIRADLERKLGRFTDLKGMAALSAERRFRNFIDLAGQLRFQIRWAHLHRIPRTSVLGHSLYVAMLSYLFSLEIGACPRRCVNNFLTGLFHDLPEVLTRDIISPVKRAVEGLSDLIKEYEKEQLEKEVYRLIPAEWIDDFVMFAEREFETLATVGGVRIETTSEEISERYNADEFNPKDGRLVKAADNLAAFIEAWAGIRNGSDSPDLHFARFNIKEQNEGVAVAGIDFGPIYSDFD